MDSSNYDALSGRKVRGKPAKRCATDICALRIRDVAVSTLMQWLRARSFLNRFNHFQLGAKLPQIFEHHVKARIVLRVV